MLRNAFLGQKLFESIINGKFAVEEENFIIKALSSFLKPNLESGKHLGDSRAPYLRKHQKNNFKIWF